MLRRLLVSSSSLNSKLIELLSAILLSERSLTLSDHMRVQYFVPSCRFNFRVQLEGNTEQGARVLEKEKVVSDKYFFRNWIMRAPYASLLVLPLHHGL